MSVSLIPSRTNSEEEEEEVVDDVDVEEEEEEAHERLRKLSKKAERAVSSDEGEGEEPDLPDGGSKDGDVDKPEPEAVKPANNHTGTKEAGSLFYVQWNEIYFNINFAGIRWFKWLHRP